MVLEENRISSVKAQKLQQERWVSRNADRNRREKIVLYWRRVLFVRRDVSALRDCLDSPRNSLGLNLNDITIVGQTKTVTVLGESEFSAQNENRVVCSPYPSSC